MRERPPVRIEVDSPAEIQEFCFSTNGALSVELDDDHRKAPVVYRHSDRDLGPVRGLAAADTERQCARDIRQRQRVRVHALCDVASGRSTE